jgi:hypothetical protein
VNEDIARAAEPEMMRMMMMIIIIIIIIHRRFTIKTERLMPFRANNCYLKVMVILVKKIHLR